MSKQELIDKLKGLMDKHDNDRETAHIAADELLLDWINDSEIREAYNSFEKWHA